MIEPLVGPVFLRLVFGGELDLDFANRVVDTVMRGYAVREPVPSSPEPAIAESAAITS